MPILGMNACSHTYTDDLHPTAASLLKSARKTFGESAISVLSNSAGTLDDVGHKQAEAAEQALGIAVIRHKQKKPACLEEVSMRYPRLQ